MRKHDWGEELGEGRGRGTKRGYVKWNPSVLEVRIKWRRKTILKFCPRAFQPTPNRCPTALSSLSTFLSTSSGNMK